MFNGRPMVCISASELLQIISKLESQISVIKNEINTRKSYDSWRWGFFNGSCYITYNTIDEAVIAIVEHYNGDFDARHKLLMIYV